MASQAAKPRSVRAVFGFDVIWHPLAQHAVDHRGILAAVFERSEFRSAKPGPDEADDGSGDDDERKRRSEEEDHDERARRERDHDRVAQCALADADYRLDDDGEHGRLEAEDASTKPTLPKPA